MKKEYQSPVFEACTYVQDVAISADISSKADNDTTLDWN